MSDEGKHCFHGDVTQADFVLSFGSKDEIVGVGGDVLGGDTRMRYSAIQR